MSVSALDRVMNALEAKGLVSQRLGRRPGKHHCAAHEDPDASLGVSYRDGVVLLQCYASCETPAVMEALGLVWSELWDEGRPTSNDWTPYGPAVAVYDYVDELGRLLFQVCRTGDKKFPQRRPDSSARSGWKWRTVDVRKVLYRLPQVLTAAAAGDTVWIVEGEKDVASLERAGVVATCNPGGAGKWRTEYGYSTSLKGARVVVCADRDEDDTGRAHARTVADELQSAGIEVRCVEPAQGKDITDHLGAGRSLDDVAEIEPANWPTRKRGGGRELIARTEDGEEPASHGTDEAPEESAKVRHGRTLDLHWLSDPARVRPVPPEELVASLVRKGELIGLGGGRGMAKTWFAMGLAAAIARGDGFFLGTNRFAVMQPARVMYCHGELREWTADERWRTVAGGDLPENVADVFDRWRIEVTRVSDTDTDRHEDGSSSHRTERTVALLDGRIETAITEQSIDLIVIDPWASYYLGSENDNSQVEAAISRLREVADNTGVAILIVHHFAKNTEVRDPEDQWRGASRLADAVDTRITLRPFYSPDQAKKQGMTRQQARRYAELTFLLRSAPPVDDLPIVFDVELGGWTYWASAPSEAAEARRTQMEPEDVAELCREKGGAWPSQNAATIDIGGRKDTARALLERAVEAGFLERYPAAKGATGYRLPDVTQQRIDTTESVSGSGGSHTPGTSSRERFPLAAPIPPGTALPASELDPEAHRFPYPPEPHYQGELAVPVVPPYGGTTGHDREPVVPVVSSDAEPLDGNRSTNGSTPAATPSPLLLKRLDELEATRAAGRGKT